MSYLGQTHTVDVSLPTDAVLDRDLIQQTFEARYQVVFGKPLTGIAIRVLNLRVAVIGQRNKLDLKLLAPRIAPGVDAQIGSRQIWADGDWHEAAIYERPLLAVGAEIAGPALLEQADTTIFVDPGLMAVVDCFGNLIISRQDSAP
jgi:N-methylhydantoinase A